jgi:hypothetical protein
MRSAIATARSAGAMTVPRYGATFRETDEPSDKPKKRVAGRR